MKEQLDRLRELQELDLKLDTLNNEKREITDRLELNKSFLNKLIADLENQKEKLEEIRITERTKKEELRRLTELLKNRKKRLTNVASTKEFNALEKEIEVQQKAIDALREEVVFLVEEISSTNESILSKEEKIVQLRESIALEVAGSASEVSSYDKEIAKLKQQETEARNAVSKRVMYKYDFIRNRRQGQAIIGAKDGHCEGCFMALPPQEFIEIQRGEKLITCPSCQRILYYIPSEPKEEVTTRRRRDRDEEEEE